MSETSAFARGHLLTCREEQWTGPAVAPVTSLARRERPDNFVFLPKRSDLPQRALGRTLVAQRNCHKVLPARKARHFASTSLETLLLTCKARKLLLVAQHQTDKVVQVHQQLVEATTALRGDRVRHVIRASHRTQLRAAASQRLLRPPLPPPLPHPYAPLPSSPPPRGAAGRLNSFVWTLTIGLLLDSKEEWSKETNGNDKQTRNNRL